MEVRLLRTLSDMAEMTSAQLHPAFHGMWDAAGAVGRIKFVIANPVPELVDKMRREAANCRLMAASPMAQNDRARRSWVPIIEAVKALDIASLT